MIREEGESLSGLRPHPRDRATVPVVLQRLTMFSRRSRSALSVCAFGVMVAFSCRRSTARIWGRVAAGLVLFSATAYCGTLRKRIQVNLVQSSTRWLGDRIARFLGTSHGLRWMWQVPFLPSPFEQSAILLGSARCGQLNPRFVPLVSFLSVSYHRG
jgi:hypothetical protein